MGEETRPEYGIKTIKANSYLNSYENVVLRRAKHERKLFRISCRECYCFCVCQFGIFQYFSHIFRCYPAQWDGKKLREKPSLTFIFHILTYLMFLKFLFLRLRLCAFERGIFRIPLTCLVILFYFLCIPPMHVPAFLVYDFYKLGPQKHVYCIFHTARIINLVLYSTSACHRPHPSM